MEMRQGDYKEAENCFRRVLNIHRDTGDRRKEVSVLIQMAELHRVQLKLHRAEEALNLARSVAAHLDDPEIRGQVMVALGALHLQGLRLEKARAAYERALVVFREAENQEREGYVLIGLGEVESRSADGSALDTLVMGATLLLQSGSKQAYFGAMLRIGEHGLRIAEAGLSLVASEAARRQARQSDNVLGQGQAMRITVKALALMRESRATLLTALAREAIAGSLQANAVDVANYYRRRAPRQLVAELDALSMNEKVSHSERIVVRILGPLLHGVNTTATDLSDVERSIEIVCRLSEQLSASSNDLITDELTDDTTMVEYGDQDGLLDSDDDPPTEGTLALPEVNGSDSAAYMVVDEQETLVLHPVETDAPPIRSRESSGVVDAASLMNGDEPDTNSEEINQMLQEAGGDRPTQEGDGDDGVQ